RRRAAGEGADQERHQEQPGAEEHTRSCRSGVGASPGDGMELSLRLGPNGRGGRSGWRTAMREDDLRPSGNIEDRRGGGGRGFTARGGGLGIGAVLVLTLLGWALGIDPSALIGGAEMV